ncbi:MAG: hypothetical protein GX620_15040 [Chloroflexi bacterium]|nr:hypothetical protein [Chloroflexota bacterium]
MIRPKTRFMVCSVAGLVVGLMVGLFVGWRVWPVEYTNTTPLALRQDRRDDYILMVAAAYAVEGNLEHASARLRVLDSEQPGWPVADLAIRLIEANGCLRDIEGLARLAYDLGARSPILSEYVEDSL